MKRKLHLIILFLYLGSIHALANINEEFRFIISNESTTYRQIFNYIENSTDYRFFYKPNDFNDSNSVETDYKGSDINSLLKKLFDGSGHTYSINKNDIIIYKKTTPTVNTQKNYITGVILDEDDNPLPGVVVSILGTTTGDVTRADGKYHINVAIGDILQYSFIGYTTQKIKVGTESFINVKLKVEGIIGDEVVIVGFGTIKKSSLTGSISVVKADQLANRPVQNIGQALQGMVPGLNLTVGNSGGELNSSLVMNIRGNGTIGDGSNSSPLVLIDGMEGDMNTLNPQDVESISIMKDAASATIYGSRAPFGVILITTKQGSKGKTIVNYNNNFRFSMPQTPNTMNSWEWANYHNIGAANSGQGATYTDEVLGKIQAFQRGELEHGTEPDGETNWGTFQNNFANTDWYDVYFKDIAFTQEHNASVSGGIEKLQYYLSANYLDQSGIIRHGDDSYDRMSFSSRITAELSPWAKVDFTTRFTRTDFERPQFATHYLYHYAAVGWPTNPVTYPKHPDIPFPQENFGNINHINKDVYGGRFNTLKNNFVQQLKVTIKPLKNWNIIGELNYRFLNETQNDYQIKTYFQAPNGSILPDSNSKQDDWATSESKMTNFINPNIYTNYEKAWDSGHIFKITAGFQFESNNYNNVYGKGESLLSPDFPSLSNTTARPVNSGTFTDWATAGFFGRINYDYKGKYLLEVSARYDGTSRFLEDQRWNLFPSVSVGWNMKNESFLKDVSAIDIIKLRGSWGQLGNQNTASLYPFYQNMPVGKDYNWIINDIKPPLYSNAPSLVSTLLTWETIESWNVGLDFGFLNNRLAGTIELFNRKTLNMVGPAPTLPGVLGTSVPKINNTDQENKGWELELSWRDRVESIGLSYGIHANISDTRQIVTNYPNLTNNFNTWYPGKESGEIWGYTTIGIAQSQEEMNTHLDNNNQDALGSKWGAGDIMYADLNGDGIVNGGEGTLTDSGDLSIIGNSTPRYRYGVTLDAAWNGFDFSMFIQGVGKRELMLNNSNGNMFWGLRGMWGSSGFEEHIDFWRPADDTSIFGPNTNSYYAKPYYSMSENNKNQKTQTRYLQDGSYARIKNIQLGYTIPSSLTNKIKMRSIRVFFSADNLATFTSLSSIFDPEVTTGAGWGDGKAYPLSKIFSFGINVTL